jgi:hypothetical protein
MIFDDDMTPEERVSARRARRREFIGSIPPAHYDAMKARQDQINMEISKAEMGMDTGPIDREKGDDDYSPPPIRLSGEAEADRAFEGISQANEDARLAKKLGHTAKDPYDSEE